MARKKPGESIRYTAADWNRHEDAADYVAKRQLGDPTAADRELISAGRIRIKNSSGADRREGEILKVGDCLLTDLTGRYPWFDAALHDGSDTPFAVLIEPLPDGQIGPAQIAGVCFARVTFAHADMKCARPDPDGTDVLMGDVLGPVRILHKPSGTGEKECLVLLGEGRFEGWGYAVDNAAEGVEGTVMVWEGSAGGQETGIEVEAECLSPIGVLADKKVTLGLMGNVLFSLPIDECEG